MNINTQEILPYVGYGLIGIFLLIGAIIILAVVRDRKKNTPKVPESVHMEDNQKTEPSKLNLKGLSRKEKNQLKKEEGHGLFTSSRKNKTESENTGFAVTRGSSDASKIAETLAESRGARTITPRNRTSSPSDLVINEPKVPNNDAFVEIHAEDENKTSFKAFATLNSASDTLAEEKETIQESSEPAPVSTPNAKPLPNLAPLPEMPSIVNSTQHKLPTTRPTPSVPGSGLLPPPPVIKQAPTDPNRRVLVNKPDNLKTPPPLK